MITAQLAAARSGTQSTKTRAEVRGGGAKPFRQKGTGRARQGSSRSPSMSGGGVALGPKPRSYAQRTPEEDGPRRPALRPERPGRDRAHHRDRRLEDHEPKTKDAATVVRKLRLTGTVLVVLAADELAVERSFANLPAVQTTTFGELSAHDVIRADWLVFSDRTLPAGPADFSGTHVVEEDDELEAAPAERRPARRPPPSQRPSRRPRRRRPPARPRPPRPTPRRRSKRSRPRRRSSCRPTTTTQRTRRPAPMRDAMSVLIRPVVSEKSYALMDRSVYTFIVDPRATKIDVRLAVEQAFGVRVTAVNTLNRKGKSTRNRRTNVRGKRADTKRAIVTLHPDDSIDLFER